jgi:hypothetical protein
MPAFRLQDSVDEEFWSFTAIQILLEDPDLPGWCQGSNETERIRAGPRPSQLHGDLHGLLVDRSGPDPGVSIERRIGLIARTRLVDTGAVRACSR